MKVARRYFSEQATTAPWQINSNATLKIQREKEAVRQRGSGKILKDFSEKYRIDTNQKTVLKNGYKKAKLVLVRRSDRDFNAGIVEKREAVLLISAEDDKPAKQCLLSWFAKQIYQVNLRNKFTYFIESLILAQDERWRRA